MYVRHQHCVVNANIVQKLVRVCHRFAALICEQSMQRAMPVGEDGAAEVTKLKRRSRPEPVRISEFYVDFRLESYCVASIAMGVGNWYPPFVAHPTDVFSQRLSKLC